MLPSRDSARRGSLVKRVGMCSVFLVFLGCGNGGRVPLVVYSPHGRDLLRLVERMFEEANPDVDIRTLDMGSQDALDRIRSERANPQADVWFGGPSTLFRRAAAESLLVAYRPSWADAIPARAQGPSGLYFAAYETPAVIAYNSTALSEDEAPRDWDDVLAPRWRGDVRRFVWAYLLMAPLSGLVTTHGILRALASRRIEWRGTLYEMRSPNETVVRGR